MSSLYPDVRTRFIATLGPKSMNYDTMLAMAKAGVDIFRANFAHMQYDMYRQVRAWQQQINQELGVATVIQADIQGPSIRLGKISDEGFFLKAGETYTFVTAQADQSTIGPDKLPINEQTIHKFLKVGQQIIFMNGAVEGDVVAIDGHEIQVKVVNSGTLRSRKSMNLPETELSTALTEKDRADLQFLMEVGVEWVAISFVSNAHHIHEVRKMLGNHPIKITSKVERRTAIENIDEIIEASDAVMVARGDLGIEIPFEQVPIVQKEIIAACHRQKKGVIVATQMMLSMVSASHPTRAEVSDVAGAVFDGADAVMLSEESAEGIDPANSVATQRTIVTAIEQYMYHRPNYFEAL
jgi:pyruvate kinase